MLCEVLGKHFVLQVSILCDKNMWHAYRYALTTLVCGQTVSAVCLLMYYYI